MMIGDVNLMKKRLKFSADLVKGNEILRALAVFTEKRNILIQSAYPLFNEA
jgi:hypothetical protein